MHTSGHSLSQALWSRLAHAFAWGGETTIKKKGTWTPKSAEAAAPRAAGFPTHSLPKRNLKTSVLVQIANCQDNGVDGEVGRWPTQCLPQVMIPLENWTLKDAGSRVRHPGLEAELCSLASCVTSNKWLGLSVPCFFNYKRGVIEKLASWHERMTACSIYWIG